MSEEIREIKGIDEFLQMSMTNNMPLSVNEKRKIFELIINLQTQLQQKENIIKGVRELAIIKKARVENEPDYSKSYLEGYEVAIQTQHLSHSGVMLETIKSTIKTTCDDFLEILDKENKQ